MKKVLFPILAVVLAVSLALPMAAVAVAAVDSVGTISDPGHPAGRSPQVAFAGCAVPEIVSSPSTVVQELYTSDTKIRVFDEQQNVVLTAGLNVDQTTDDITSAAVILAGARVDSHYIHLDNVGTSGGVRGVVGMSPLMAILSG